MPKGFFLHKGKLFNHDLHQQEKGHYGHKGRPGQRGGSLPGSGVSSKTTPDNSIEGSLKNPKDLKEMKSTLSKLNGNGDKRKSIGFVLQKAGYKYETSWNSAGGASTDMYIRGKYDILVEFEFNKTKVKVERQGMWSGIR